MSDHDESWEQIAADYRAGLVEEAQALALCCASESLAERARELSRDIQEGLEIDRASLELALLEDEAREHDWTVRWRDLTFAEGAD